MNNKDIKKQPSAQALSDDDLESVGGGYTPIYGKGGKMGLDLTSKEGAYLKDLGISYEQFINSWGQELGTHSFKDAHGNSLSIDQVEKILQDGGFKRR